MVNTAFSVLLSDVLFLILSLTGTGAFPVPCLKKDFGKGSIVCVCNVSYCDTVQSETRRPTFQYNLYTSTKDGERLQKSGGSFSPRPDPSALLFKINRNTTFQTIIGFGGTFTDAAGINIASLPDGAKDKLITSYYGADGIEYSLGRIPIASNDFSTDVYSYDFTNGDTTLTKFTIAGEDHLYKLPYIDQAVSISHRNVSLFASPWSSPDWMKTSGSMVGYGPVDPSMSKVYANYLARFLQEYDSFLFHGKLWGLTAQNQPSNGCIKDFPYQAMCWTPESMRDWIERDLGPSLKEYGYEYIKLMIVDEPMEFLPYWTEALQINTSEALNYVSGFAVHSDPSDVTSTLPLKSTHAQFPDKFILSSKASIDNLDVAKNAVALGDWGRAEKYIRSIMDDLNNWVSGWTDWNLALDVDGGPSWIHNSADSPVIVDKNNSVFYKQPMFYAVGQFSKFIPPGSIRVTMETDSEVNGSTPSVAFLRPDGSMVAVVANFNDYPVQIAIQNSAKFINYALPRHSIATFTWST